MKTKWYLVLTAILLSLPCYSPAQNLNNTRSTSPGIIPLPAEIKSQNGVFTLPQNIKISAKTTDEVNVANFIKDWLAQYHKTVSIGTDTKAHIILSTSAPALKEEAYQLDVTAKNIKIAASSGPGLFYGFQTLLQLVPAGNKTTLQIPLVTVQDQPTFKWRGSMLDVSRHFFPVSFIKKYIDFISAYKLNTFHWHLTDDQGWRIEIKKYPKLTQVAAFRKETLIGAQQQMKKPEDYKYDATPYGGFYTQDEIKEVVAYAQKRYITVVPEIEMPGHSVAVLAAYPELACKPGNYAAATKWGVFEDIVCPSEQTFQFFENVLTEVATLFPGKYIHIGGDEAPKTVWKESAAVQKIMADNQIKDVEKVQGWFNARIEKFLQSKGKKLIGWDEILEGGISPASTVMSWRGEAGGIEAAKHGNDVVMSPSPYVYLDYGQHPQVHHPDEPLMIGGYLPLEKVYNYNPLPTELTPALQKHILGVQANLWTEYITTPQKVEYALFPRILAVAEMAWTAPDKKNFSNFENRLASQFARLDEKDIYYRVPEPKQVETNQTNKDKAIFTLTTLVPGGEIRYTLDGHIPDKTTKLYSQPIAIPKNQKIKVRAVTITPNGRHSTPVEFLVP